MAWYFDDEKNYIYEHKDERLQCNGFSISKGLSDLVADEFDGRYFESDERGLIFILFFDQISSYILNERNVTEDEFLSIFGVSKSVYFSEDSIRIWEYLIDI